MTLCPTGIWTGWSNLREFCSFFAKKKAEIPNHDIKRHLLEVEQVPFGVLGGRGRACPARLWMVYGRLWMVYGWLWEGRGPGMPGPYRAAIFAAGGCGGRRAVLGRPVKAPPAVCGCRSPSSFRRGFGCLRLRGFLRLWSVRIQIRLIVRDGLVQLVDFCLRGIAGGEQVGVLAVGVQGGLGVL